MNSFNQHLSSFRDNSGSIFSYSGKLYRRVNPCYKEDYDHFMDSGLYQELAANQLLIPHKESFECPFSENRPYKIIQPDLIPFISYPYEWSFSQLKDAALLTLEILKVSMKYKMILKDASAFNVQFYKGGAIFIDSLSFQKWNEGDPWRGYRQFCQHFLSPLLLMKYKDIRLNQIFKCFIDGIPLDITSKLLPRTTWLNFNILSHIHMHALSQNYFSDKEIKNTKKISTWGLTGFIESLLHLTKNISLNLKQSEWKDYYSKTNYQEESFRHKAEIVSKFLEEVHPDNLWDIGSNTGFFSRIAAQKNIHVISFDMDPACIEKNYLECKKNSIKNILPLFLDLTNPTPAIGWNNQERSSLKERGPADTILALALIHHLTITGNIPFDFISKYFSENCSSLIIEFIDINDSQVKRLLRNRNDHFENFNEAFFEEQFKKRFSIIRKIPVKNSCRTLYLMKNNELPLKKSN